VTVRSHLREGEANTELELAGGPCLLAVHLLTLVTLFVNCTATALSPSSARVLTLTWVFLGSALSLSLVLLPKHGASWPSTMCSVHSASLQLPL
jgi:hypothetical protein